MSLNKPLSASSVADDLVRRGRWSEPRSGQAVDPP
jgi:hypothetical protein